MKTIPTPIPTQPNNDIICIPLNCNKDNLTPLGHVYKSLKAKAKYFNILFNDGF